MAKLVLAKVVGSEIKEVADCNTVGEVQEELGIGSGYTAMVNGETAEAAYKLRENDYVTFAKATKGGI